MAGTDKLRCKANTQDGVKTVQSCDGRKGKVEGLAPEPIDLHGVEDDANPTGRARKGTKSHFFIRRVTAVVNREDRTC